MHPTGHFCPLCGTPTPTGVCPAHGVAGMTQGGWADPSQVFQPGAVLGGRYRIDYVLAVRGAQATFLATRLDDGQAVVIQALGVERLARRARLLDGLFREARIASIFQRADLTSILDFGVEPVTQNPFLVIRYQPGRSIQEIIAPGSAEGRTAAAFVEVCHGLLDSHDSEVLDSAGAMPTAVPGLDEAGGPPRPQNIVRAPRGPRSPRRGTPEAGGGADAGVRTRVAVLVGLVLFAVGLWIVSPESYESSYYRPDINQTTRLWNPRYQEQRGPRGSVTGPSVGEIEIESEPEGAAIWLGSDIIGTTPGSVPRPSGGERLRLTLRLGGYLDKQLMLHRDSPDSVDVELFEKKKSRTRDIIGEREDDGRGDVLRANPFERREEAYEDPMRKSPFVNPFGEPGTAPRLPEPEPEDPLEDLE